MELKGAGYTIKSNVCDTTLADGLQVKNQSGTCTTAGVSRPDFGRNNGRRHGCSAWDWSRATRRSGRSACHRRADEPDRAGVADLVVDSEVGLEAVGLAAEVDHDTAVGVGADAFRILGPIEGEPVAVIGRVFAVALFRSAGPHPLCDDMKGRSLASVGVVSATRLERLRGRCCGLGQCPKRARISKHQIYEPPPPRRPGN
jgi:hypothetical protein